MLFGAQRVAAKIAGTLFYFQGDHLGSSSVVMTQAGTSFYSRQTYFPYGAQRTTEGSALPTDYTFTGQKSDDSTGLMFYGARYYDVSLGRFTQPDTIVPSPLNPQSLNRFSYVLNNPVKFTDPTGHAETCEESCGSEGTGDPTTTTTATTTTTTTATTTTPATTGENQEPEKKEKPENPITELLEEAVGKFQAIGIAWDWFWENGTAYQWFGPDQYVTQYLMRDEGVTEARNAFIHQGVTSYDYGFGFDDYPRETFQALTGQDLTGSVLGSYHVEMFDKQDGNVLFIVSNTTGRESASRNPFGGSSTSSIEGMLFQSQPLMMPKSVFENRQRVEDGPGGNLYQRYFWEERLFSSGFY